MEGTLIQQCHPLTTPCQCRLQGHCSSGMSTSTKTAHQCILHVQLDLYTKTHIYQNGLCQDNSHYNHSIPVNTHRKGQLLAATRKPSLIPSDGFFGATPGGPCQRRGKRRGLMPNEVKENEGTYRMRMGHCAKTKC